MVNCFFDHQSIYINDQPFYPIISSNPDDKNSNTSVISLDCSNTSTLAFNKHFEKADFIKSQNKYIIWDIHLDLENPHFLIHDELYLKSISHSLKYFTTNLYAHFQDVSLGVILYSGKVPKYELNYALFASWLDNLSENERKSFDSKYLKQLFSSDSLAHYLRLIAPNIPDELLMIIKLDVSDIKSPAQLMYLLSKERFEYFLLALKGSKLAIPAIQWKDGKSKLGKFDSNTEILKKQIPNVGVCFASYEKVTKKELDQFDRIFNDLSSNNIDFRVLEEMYATEQWDGLDYIIARQSSLSLHGKRVLQGFNAASGTTVYHDISIGILNELSFEAFKALF